jgi:chemotaxis protein methyltransferase CheR
VNVTVRDSRAIADPDVAALVDDLDRAWALDYRGWSASVLEARIRARAEAEGLAGPAELRARVLDDKTCLERLLVDLSARPRGPFFDSDFALALRREILPRLRTYPSIRIWHAGCSTGDEVYATAILLREEGLLSRTTIYATDVSPQVIDRARSGRSDAPFEACAGGYVRAGGGASLAEYYLPDGQNQDLGQDRAAGMIARPLLRERVVFAEHSFASDASFNEFHLIVCRGVFGQYGSALQERAFGIVHDSLCRFGYLALDAGESVAMNACRDAYEQTAWAKDVYRRVR